jgi:hypothetical protein
VALVRRIRSFGPKARLTGALPPSGSGVSGQLHFPAGGHLMVSQLAAIGDAAFMFQDACSMVASGSRG